MKKVLAFFLLYCFNSNAYIVKISQLYNPKENKRIILLADMHIGPEAIIKYNKHQKELILSKLENLFKNKDYTILSEAVDPLELALDRSPILIELTKLYANKVINIDTIRWKAFENKFISNILISYLKLNKVNFLDKSLFDSIYKEYNLDNLTILKKFKKLSLKEQEEFINNLINIKEIANILVKELNNLKVALKNNNKKIAKFLKKHIDLIIAKIENIKVKSNNLSEVSKLQDFCTHISNIEMLVNIINQKASNIILFAGLAHVDSIETKLLKMGYEGQFTIPAIIDDINIISSEDIIKLFDKSLVNLSKRVSENNLEFIKALGPALVFKYFFNGNFTPIPDEMFNVLE